jgi:hypothetical protein
MKKIASNLAKFSKTALSRDEMKKTIAGINEPLKCPPSEIHVCKPQF